MTLSEICSLVSGELFAPGGSESQQIRGIRSMAEAREGDITFLANVRYRPELKRLKASAVLLSKREPDAAIALLSQMRRLAANNGGLLIGVDLHKDRAVLERAYNDAAGVTAAFNMNLLRRLNRELLGDFDASRFVHRAMYNEVERRIEMHLISRENHAVRVAGESFRFKEDEYIVTEYSYKHTLPGFAALAAKAGFAVEQVWIDDRRWFSVQYLSVC